MCSYSFNHTSKKKKNAEYGPLSQQTYFDLWHWNCFPENYGKLFFFSFPQVCWMWQARCYFPVSKRISSLRSVCEHSAPYIQNNHVSSYFTHEGHVNWVPCRHDMVHPQVADVEDGLQMWRVAPDVLNKQSRTADCGWSSNLGLGGRLTNAARKC